MTENETYWVTTRPHRDHKHSDRDCHGLTAAYDVREARDAEIEALPTCKLCEGDIEKGDYTTDIYNAAVAYNE